MDPGTWHAELEAASRSGDAEEQKNCSEISKIFELCISPDILDQYLEMCQKDVCTCESTETCDVCTHFEETARQCTAWDGEQWQTWRQSTGCAQKTCPGNQVHKECGPACVATCTNPNSQIQCEQCVNTCDCPAGMVLDNIRKTDNCIPKTECPCRIGGSIYLSGERTVGFCHNCTCKNGEWECLPLSCPQFCKFEEGNYITTFDGKSYQLMGDCSYVAALIEYQIQKNGVVYLDGIPTQIPLRKNNINIFYQSSNYIQVSTDNGLKMQLKIGPIAQLYISLPNDAKGLVRGLCGNFNDKVDDDFLSSENIVEATAITFCHSWKAESCVYEITPPAPCVSSENEKYAREHCSLLKEHGGYFSICHSSVNYKKYYEMCVDAACTCQNIDDCICAAFEGYAHECAARGIIVVNWRKDICRVNCPETNEFLYGMKACNQTCRSLVEHDFTCDIEDVLVSGCGCPEGLYLDDFGDCVDRFSCPCKIGDTIIKHGHGTAIQGTICYCKSGSLSCADQKLSTPKIDCQGKLFLNCTENNNQCVKSCQNLNVPCPSKCVPACICPNGQVEDENGNCIYREECSCLYGDVYFKPGAVIHQKCNNCTCKGGSWDCSKNHCSKTCLVYGDGSFETFDGQRFFFDSNCQHIFSQTSLEEVGAFKILVESVACCERGVTCSRVIKILLKDLELKLIDGKVQTLSSNEVQCIENIYTMHMVGFYLVLEFANGMTVMWDKNTRFSVSLTPRWQNKVFGLCGNYNSRIEDDLMTKSKSLVTDTLDFAQSWSSPKTCSEKAILISPCDRNPYCYAWAARKCNIIMSKTFKKCHKLVDPSEYYSACVDETCACDLEGRFLGFCTAVAVYAEACSKVGACIDWRTPESCPIYCDYYNEGDECNWHYKPCGSAISKTCNNHPIGRQYSTFLEGCYAKCPENAPYLDENTMKCVNLPQCTCYFNGLLIQPNEVKVTDCGQCTCQNGTTTCEKLATTSMPTVITISAFEETATATTVSPPTEPFCHGEWSPWFNQNTPTISKSKDVELLFPIMDKLCPHPEDVGDIQCRFVDYPEKPINESADDVVCENDLGLVCKVSKSTSRKFCDDYEIRVCCKSPVRTVPTTLSGTTKSSEVTPSVHEVIKVVRFALPQRKVSYIIHFSVTEPICHGVWSPWFNQNTPTISKPKDVELLSYIKDKLCPHPEDVGDIQCQYVDYPEKPLSESADIVFCEKDLGLVCKVSKSSPRKVCDDYKIRVCCKSRMIAMPTTLGETTKSTETFTTRITSTVATGRSSTLQITISEPVCHGEWSSWFNQHTPTISKPKDVELLFLIKDKLCPHPEAVGVVQCQYVDYPEKPLSESVDNVICENDLGLVCKVSEGSSRMFCDDYKIRVCCKSLMMPMPTTISETSTSGLTLTTASTGKSSTSQVTISAQSPTTVTGTTVSPATIRTGPGPSSGTPMTSSRVTRIEGLTSAAVTGRPSTSQITISGEYCSTPFQNMKEICSKTCIASP
ncbi:mucin-2-like [Rhincodon typus]|uniref:mucin-2-like n=1 Tax=Rhincodon typus TaxID=259920 RepID=UPI00202FF031|nr:mucin-2-like [Rhincodon typus]